MLSLSPSLLWPTWTGLHVALLCDLLRVLSTTVLTTMAGCRVATGAGAGDVEGATTTGLGTLGTADLLELCPPVVHRQTHQTVNCQTYQTVNCQTYQTKCVQFEFRDTYSGLLPHEEHKPSTTLCQHTRLQAVKCSWVFPPLSSPVDSRPEPAWWCCHRIPRI